MTTTRIKDWAKFQHFKDRKPPWIKLYRDILDDKEWHRLDAKAAKALVMLWLVASENDGALPDRETLAFRLRTTETEVDSFLSKLSHWLVREDISAISARYQGDASERETERERERETEAETKKKAQAPAFEPPEWINRKHWDVWHACAKRKKATDDQKQMAVDKLAGWRDAGLDFAGALENAALGGNQGLFLPSTPRAGFVPNKQQSIEDANFKVGQAWAKGGMHETH